MCSGAGSWEPFPVEDLENLDALRAKVGLGTMADCKTMIVNVCHESTGETIRRAMEAAKAKDGGATLNQ